MAYDAVTIAINQPMRLDPSPEEYARACAERRADRLNCDWPEIAVVGEQDAAVAVACLFRKAGIETATYLLPERRQVAKALKDDPDYLVFADSLKIRDTSNGCEGQLDPRDPAGTALRWANCGYLPLDWALADAVAGNVGAPDVEG